VPLLALDLSATSSLSPLARIVPVRINARPPFSDAIDRRLANTPPTTLAGVAAVLRLANEIEDGNEWPDTDTVGRNGWHYRLRCDHGGRARGFDQAQPEKAVRQWAGQGNPSRSQSAVSRVGAMLPVDGLHARKLPRVG
jgi:hypothetical protein